MNFRDLIAILSPPRATLALCLVLMLGASAMALVNPWIAGQLAALILGQGSPYFSGFASLVLVWAAVLVTRALLGFFNGYVIGSAAESVLAGLRSRLYEHLQLLPVSYFDEQRRGNVLSILTNDSAIVSNFVTGTLVRLLPMVLTFAGAAAMVLWLNPLIGLLILVLMPVHALVMKVVGRHIRPLGRRWVDAYGAMVGLVDENLGLLPAIKSYTRERFELDHFDDRNRALLHLSRRQLLLHNLLAPLTGLLAGLGLLLIVWLGYRAIAAGTMAEAELVSLLFYAALLNQPLGQLANVYGQIQNTRGASERILAFLGEQPEPADDGLPPLGPVRGEIIFDGVAFAYPSAPERPVLRSLDLAIRAGETVAIVGENGAGKSTLAHLLMRLVEPTAGHIRIDGRDIAGVSLGSLRASIGLVAQHTLLLNGTIADNIAWGQPFADQEAIEAAARLAGAHDFILALPAGYQTSVGDQGLKLSGGQRQRLSLARAMLKNPPILILDEATSMFDPAGEHALLRDCEPLLRERTVILITHRPASLGVADRVLLLRDGRLTDVLDTGHYLRTGEPGGTSPGQGTANGGQPG
ncbi:MAG: ABC transporter ATP-binding protein [Porticoccaceae bacterium]|jgi:ABC-type multidrug transport system fused ATPase/permease subunit|nr:ABC transporter ATP-binding protein [Porticoccaceae bacterium]